MIALGDFRLHLLQECVTRMDAGGAFGLVPRALYSRYLTPDADNTVPMPGHVLLVQTSTQSILIDTGSGERLTPRQIENFRLTRPRGTLADSLARLGLTAADIDLVIDTHLHGDHAGGNVVSDGDGVRPAFPNAEYVVQRREYDDAMRPNERTRATYDIQNYAPLVESGRMRLLDGDTELAPGVFGVRTPGHTPGHMSVRLESGGQQALFVCDLASFAVHFERLGWMTAYDVEPLVTLETKRVWQRWALETGALLIFPHDSVRPAGRYVRTGDGPAVVEPVDFPYV